MEQKKSAEDLFKEYERTEEYAQRVAESARAAMSHASFDYRSAAGAAEMCIAFAEELERELFLRRYDRLDTTEEEKAAESNAAQEPPRVLHNLKVWPQYFDALLNGTKTFEIRKTNDRKFLVGDWVELHEWEPTSRDYSGRKLTRKISYIASAEALGGFAFLQPNVVVFGLVTIDTKLP